LPYVLREIDWLKKRIEDDGLDLAIRVETVKTLAAYGERVIPYLFETVVKSDSIEHKTAALQSIKEIRLKHFATQHDRENPLP